MHLAGVDRQIETLEDFLAVNVDVQVFDLQKRHELTFSSCHFSKLGIAASLFQSVTKEMPLTVIERREQQASNNPART
jgi:hypothetical protein